MIAIFNISRKGAATARYQLQINDDLICRFKHKRADGLAECLRRAADAVEKARAMDIAEIVRKIEAKTGN